MKEVYQVLAGMLGQEQRVAQIANNLANVNTVGFKKDGAMFQDYLAVAAREAGVGPDAQTSSRPEKVSSWPDLSVSYTDFSMGSLQTTGRPLDVAIEGEEFFEIKPKNASETFYTRAGNFTLDAQGGLVTPEGHAVLDENGRAIALNPQLGTPQITSDGMIRQGGADVARLGLVKFQDPQQLVKVGDGLFQAPAGVLEATATGAQVRSGMLEGSNVNAIREMVDMIETQRAYDVNQKAILAIDDITSKRIEAAMS